jgi:hypothetical protein
MQGYSRRNLHRLFNWLIAAVWLINGVICKILNLVPRHEQIVGQILGHGIARPLTLFIGVMEVGMAYWVISGIRSRMCVIVQIVVVGLMNLLEFFLVPELLLWGKWNAAFALVFMVFVYFNGYVCKPRHIP